jgi:hypothetical protein
MQRKISFLFYDILLTLHSTANLRKHTYARAHTHRTEWEKFRLVSIVSWESELLIFSPIEGCCVLGRIAG